MSVLQTKSLDIGYPGKTISNGINLTVEKGQMICLLGQNGVGKSTLVRTLANMQPALAGEVLIQNKAIDLFERKELAKRLGIVTTQRIGVSNMSVRNLVALGRFPYTDWLGREKEIDTVQIEKAIDICKIQFIEKAKLGEISDGQFQKVMIARALAQNSDIILMDEPTAHLDVVNRHDIFNLLSEIKREQQKTIIISTHELDLASQFADTLWLMDFNETIVTGETSDLIKCGAIQKIFHLDGSQIDISNLLRINH